MFTTSKELQNAKRLSEALDRYSEDKRTIEILAHYLNYQPEQLKEDIEALKELLKDKTGSTFLYD